MLIYDVYLPDYREVSLPIVISKLQPMLFIQMELKSRGFRPKHLRHTNQGDKVLLFDVSLLKSVVNKRF